MTRIFWWCLLVCLWITSAGAQDRIFRSGFETGVSIKPVSVTPAENARIRSKSYLTFSAKFPFGSLPVSNATLLVDGEKLEDCAQKVVGDYLDISCQHLLMPPGLHTVRLEYEKGSYQWSFTAVAGAKLVASSPSEPVPVGQSIELDMRLSDVRPVLTREKVYIDFGATDVTSLATIEQISAQEIRIRYRPSSSQLSPGSHIISVYGESSDGISFSDGFGLQILRPENFSIDVLAPSNNLVVTQTKVEFNVKVATTSSNVKTVKINNEEALPTSVDASYEIYSLDVTLNPGVNQIPIVVEFDDGTTRTATRTVTYDAPPVVTITSPRDWETFGLAASINGAPVSGTLAI
jgi:hypothetical protein